MCVWASVLLLKQRIHFTVYFTLILLAQSVATLAKEVIVSVPFVFDMLPPIVLHNNTLPPVPLHYNTRS